MNPDIFESLADVEVPPPPTAFDEQLHARVNRSLTALQFIDLAVRAAPWALLHFGRAFIGLVNYTLSGQYENRRK